MILGLQAIGEYVTGLAKSLYTRGFDLTTNPLIETDSRRFLAVSVVAVIPSYSPRGATEISLRETWRPLRNQRWERHEYTYDLIDRPMNRRCAFHLHDRDAAEPMLGAAVHEHCEETLGQPLCAHYLGRELPQGHVAIDLLMAAWTEPGVYACAGLICLR